MNEEEIPIEKQTEIIELERRDPQSEAKYWNQKYTETILELFKEKEKNKKLEEERLTATKIKEIEFEAYSKARADFERDYKKSSQLYEKVIDMMANDIERIDTTDELIGYYFKKARGEK